jgi:hypothetical protein
MGAVTPLRHRMDPGALAVGEHNLHRRVALHHREADQGRGDEHVVVEPIGEDRRQRMTKRRHQDASGLADGRDDPAFVDETSDGLVVERPQGVGRRLLVMAGHQDAVLVASRHQHQRAVDRHDLVHEHRDIHCPRLRHPVVPRPGAVILMPLPDIALERRLRVDFILVHVEGFAKYLLDRTDQPRVMAEEPKGLVVGVRGEGGARRAGLLAPHFLSVRRVDRSASSHRIATSSSAKQLGRNR